MSIRSITVQYIGNTLFLPKLERDVKLIVERDYGTADLDKRYVQERTCELEMNIDLTAIQCDRCGYKLPKGTELEKVRFCAGCGAKVVEE